MSTETEFETWVRSQLAEVTQGVTPCPDPYGRLVRRRRFGRLSRVFLACAAALAAAATGTVVALSPAGHGPTPNPTNTYTGRLHWLASLLEAAPRGAVAADPSFTADLVTRVEQAARDPQGGGLFQDSGGQPLGEQTARVLFADDIGDRRIALVAMQSPRIPDVSRRYPRARLLWLVGARGDSPQRLFEDGTLNAGPVDPYAFFAEATDAPTRVAVVPPECTIEAAPMTDPEAWRPEPTGSYIVRTPQQYVPERWRVSCGGVVRQQGPASRGMAIPQELLQSSGGHYDLGDLARILSSIFGFELLQPPTALWDGPVPGADASPFVAVSPPVVNLVAAPDVLGGWMGLVNAQVEQEPGALTVVCWETFHADADPSSLLSVPLIGWSHEVLVYAPSGAATVQLLTADGAILVQSPVAQRVVLLRWPATAAQPPVQTQALDASGAVMATADFARTGVGPEFVSNWD